MNSWFRFRWWSMLAVFVLIAVGCSSDGPTDHQEPDAGPVDAESEDAGPYANEICPDDNGTYPHLEHGSCIAEGSEDHDVENCPPDTICNSPDHCVGYGGGGGHEPRTECLTVDCGVFHCHAPCECIAESVCACPED